MNGYKIQLVVKLPLCSKGKEDLWEDQLDDLSMIFLISVLFKMNDQKIQVCGGF